MSFKNWFKKEPAPRSMRPSWCYVAELTANIRRNTRKALASARSLESARHHTRLCSCLSCRRESEWVDYMLHIDNLAELIEQELNTHFEL